MITKKQIEECNTLEDLGALDLGLDYSVGGRGGYVGLWASKVAEHFNIPVNYLPRKFGAYCNYLGGGIRGAIMASSFSKDVPEKKARILEALAEACKRAYENAENETGMNDDYEDGETNWEAEATKAARKANLVSAY